MSSTVGKNNFDFCKRCGTRLKQVQKRYAARCCAECLVAENRPNYEYSMACREAMNSDSDESDGGNVFEDDPKAVNEIEHGKVIKQSVGYVYTESPMAEPIVDIKK
jgi:hypothetical protein